MRHSLEGPSSAGFREVLSMLSVGGMSWNDCTGIVVRASRPQEDAEVRGCCWFLSLPRSRPRIRPRSLVIGHGDGDGDGRYAQRRPSGLTPPTGGNNPASPDQGGQQKRPEGQ